MSDEDNGLVTLAEMASRLRLQPQELRRDVDEGRLPAVRVGAKGLLFDPGRVLEILRERASAATGGDPGRRTRQELLDIESARSSPSPMNTPNDGGPSR